MIEDYHFCVNSICQLMPKVFLPDERSLTHLQCKIVKFIDILLIDSDELLKQDLNQVIAKADESINQIELQYKQIITEIRQASYKQITEDFVEIQRLQQIFTAFRNKDKDVLIAINGDLSYLIDDSKIKVILLRQRESESKYSLEHKELSKKINAILKDHIQKQVQQIKIEEPIKKQIPPQWQPSEELLITQLATMNAGYYTVTRLQNRKLTIKAKECQAVTDLGKLIVDCVKLQPNKLAINLSNTKIVDLRALSELKHMVSLTGLEIFLGTNLIVDISPLSDLITLLNLTSLVISLHQNSIVDISPLSALKSLVNLTSLVIYLQSNLIVHIDPLSELKSLINLTSLVLFLQQNQIVHIKPLSQLKSLINMNSLEIHLDGNKHLSSQFKEITLLHQLDLIQN